MKKCLIVGKPKVGKTLFFINFAEFLGIQALTIKYSTKGKTETKTYRIEDAKKNLISKQPFTTKGLQAMEVSLSTLNSKKQIQIIDSTSLLEGIHSHQEIRTGMAQTLAALHESDMILHMIDTTSLEATDFHHRLDDVDEQIIKYGQLKNNYVILGNKIDLLNRKNAILLLDKKLPQQTIIPISALTTQGFLEVRAFVAHKI